MKTKRTHIGALAIILVVALYTASNNGRNAAAEDGSPPISTPAAGVTTTDTQNLTFGPEPSSDVMMNSGESTSAAEEAVLRLDPTYNPWGVDLSPKVANQLRTPTRPDAVVINVIYNPAATCPATRPGNPDWTLQPWPPNAQTAMTMAAQIWSVLLNGNQPVVVHACWYSSLGDGVLGSAGATSFLRDFTNAPQANTWYPIALANQFTNSDSNGADPEIRANFSAGFTWYFGLDGRVTNNQIDFLSTALHEIGHGLGFSGSARWDNGVAPNECDGIVGHGCVLNPPRRYDRWVRSNGQGVVDQIANNSAALGTALTTDTLRFHGPAATIANGNTAPRLYAPPRWEPGSSFSHLDELTFNNTVNALMTPSLSFGEHIHDPGPVGLSVLVDLGWTTNQSLNDTYVDWRNTGFENGTFANPYNTVKEGVNAVQTNGIVNIAAGNYNESLNITRQMTLQAFGGAVTIGD